MRFLKCCCQSVIYDLQPKLTIIVLMLYSCRAVRQQCSHAVRVSARARLLTSVSKDSSQKQVCLLATALTRQKFVLFCSALKEGAASTYGLTDGSAETRVRLVCFVERTEGNLATSTVVNLIARVRPAKVPPAVQLPSAYQHLVTMFVPWRRCSEREREKKKKTPTL